MGSGDGRFNRPRKIVVSSLAVAVLLSGCASTPHSGPYGVPAKPKKSACASNNNQSAGTFVGLLAGAALGALVAKGGQDPSAAIAVGAALGGLTGNLIGRDMDKRACELEKIAARHNVEMDQEKIVWNTAPVLVSTRSSGAAANRSTTKSPPNAPKNDQVIGQISRWYDEAFLPGSAQLTSQARDYFTEVAKEHVPASLSRDQRQAMSANERSEYDRNAIKPILLVGHTDDSGDSVVNQALSEARAKAVAKVFEDAGVMPLRLYYRGAGDALPVANNASAEGRARNRRVEIIEFADVASMESYLGAIHPIEDFYSKPAVRQASALPVAPTSEEKPKAAAPVTAEPARPSPPVIAQVPPKFVGPSIDLGGKSIGQEPSVVLAALGGQRPAAVVFRLVGQASAASLPNRSCIDDRPKYAGSIRQLSNDAPLALKTADYIPGMSDVVWSDVVNGNLIALNSVAVKKSGTESVRNPTIDIIENFASLPDRAKSQAKPSSTSPSQVVTYEGNKAFLYRAFANQSSPIICVDIAMPYGDTGEFKAVTGRVYYHSKSGEPMVAPFVPGRL